MPALQLDSLEKNGLIDDDKKGQDSSALLARRIEFHLARKPISASPNNSKFKLVTLNPSTSTLPTKSSSPSLPNKSGPSDVFDSSLDSELSFRFSYQRIGAGLENLGNTCYLNSVIQCLTYTEPLVAYLQSGKHHYTCHIAGFCALCAIHKHVSRALQSAGRILAPKDLVANLRCISRNFRNARQEDAHEYMIQLLESMHKCCLPSGVPPESSGAYEKSLVYKIFGGRLRSQVKCLRCSYSSDTFDPFLDLSLEIMKADSLYKALAHFTAAEQLDGGDRQYKCERCKQKVRAFKQLTIHKAPFVLGIHLKRFSSYLAEKKIDKKVHFDCTLDLKPFVSGTYEGDLTYKLYGVLVHAGWSTRSGHYYCFVRTSSGSWYSLDDRRVIQVSERTVLEQKAYMLFYVRDRKNYTPKKAVDAVQKENFMRTMKNASSCSIPGVQVFQNGGVNKNSNVLPSSIAVKGSESSKMLEVQVQQNILNSSAQPAGDREMVVGPLKEEGLKSTVDNHPILSKPSCELPSAKPNGDSEMVMAVSKEQGPKTTLDIHRISRKLKDSKHKLPSAEGAAVRTKSPKCSRRQQLMKRIIKSRVIGMHLSTKLLYRASISLRKRRKCRRMKQDKQNVSPEHVLKKNLSTGDGTSTSGRSSDLTDKCMDSHINNLSSGRRDEEKDAAKQSTVSNNSNSIVNPARQAKDSFTCSKTELETSRLSQKRASCGLEVKDMNIGSVGHWEGVGSQILESNGPNNSSIGYVLDEWDEDYDRGRRKKVRVSRNSFGGPNPFQEIAASKAKFKARKDASNQPFRI